MSQLEPLLVFSHLRWDGVYQRPQHLLSRMSAQRPVYFIEEPIHDPDSPPHWELSRYTPNVLVCRPHTPCAAPGFDDQQLPYLSRLLSELIKGERLEAYAVWMYTPMALPLMQQLDPNLVVYDCMDELSAFRGAPPEMVAREAELMRCADLVFTGGQSLYQSKRTKHRNIHCFPSSVDANHFRPTHGNGLWRGRLRRLPEPADQGAIPYPRLGFYGVIDERINLDLIDLLARAHSDWQIVMVGPVVKIDQASLPRADNIHYLGQRSYELLPAYLAGWDVALLPFALNEATRFISPTKTLEYMAAEKMIVSTPIADVVKPYGDIVFLGHSPDMFVVACEHALNATPVERASRIKLMREVLAHTSWQSTVRNMQRLMIETLKARTFTPVPAGAPAARSIEPMPVPSLLKPAEQPARAVRARSSNWSTLRQ